MHRRVLVVALVCLATSAAILPSSALARDAPRPPATGPQAQISCPICLPAAIAALRGATLIRAAGAARAIVQVSRFAAPAFRRAVSPTRLRRAVQASRKFRGKSRRWVRRNWARLGKPQRACIKGAGLLSAEQFIDGGFVTEGEFDAWALFYYPFLGSLDKAQFKVAVDWREPLETAAAGCAVGWLALR